MSIINALYQLINQFTNWLWGVPILFLLVGGGIVISIIIGNVQFTQLGFIFRNTLGKIFDKNEQNQRKAKGISPYQAMLAAISATVGTGNIVGVGAAIALGGPGALFWMWVCGFLAMGIKFSEVTMSVKYRQKDERGGYKAGPFMYMKDGLHCKLLAGTFGIMMLITLSIICAVHASAITSNLSSIGINKYISMSVMAVFVLAITFGGMKTLVKITDKLVPMMGVIYVVFAMVVIIANIGNIGNVFVSIFQGAFNGWAALGGFTGATLAQTIRWGLARGVFSNDAGLGLSASVQAQAESIDHPAQQGMWAVVETFLDTIVICSLTGFVILFSGIWQAGGDGSTFTTQAMGSVMGSFGQYGAILSLVLFGLSSLITDVQGVMIQAVSMFNSKTMGRVFQFMILALVIAGSIANIRSVFVFADFANGIVLLLNIPSLILLHKVLRETSREWFSNKGDMTKIMAARNDKTDMVA